jgi:hemolysin activation/secretion protein
VKTALGIIALLGAGHAVAAPELPNAGTQMQQIPVAPTLQKPVPSLPTQPLAAPAPSPENTQTIRLKALQVRDATLFSQTELVAASGFVAGSAVTLADLCAMAARISTYYRAHGYFLAQAFVAGQEIENGVVTITVVEGRYGDVRLKRNPNLALAAAAELLATIQAGSPVAAPALERSLLLLSDLPGVTVRSSLAPGTAVGTSDLQVDISAGPRVTGSLDADNAGNRYTGRERIGLSAALNNPTGAGDVLSGRLLSSTGKLLDARLGYQRQVGEARAGFAVSHLSYSLGEEFSSLLANGTADSVSISGSYPIIRSRARNLWAQTSVDITNLSDNIDATGLHTDKRLHKLNTGLYGDNQDGLAGGGSSAFSLDWSHGALDIRNASVAQLDAATARSNGKFDKLAFTANRSQTLHRDTSLSLNLRGQIASHNLDSAEKMVLGGAAGVRAYPEGEAHGDRGLLATLELRSTLPVPAALNARQVQLVGFADAGTVMVNKRPWDAVDNRRTLSSAGLGLRWIQSPSLSLRLDLAHKLGAARAVSAPDANTRFWAQAVSFF